jgi:hypothetical protein
MFETLRRPDLPKVVYETLNVTDSAHGPLRDSPITRLYSRTTHTRLRKNFATLNVGRAAAGRQEKVHFGSN